MHILEKGECMKTERRGCIGVINLVGIFLFLLAPVGWVHAGTSGPLTYEVRVSSIQITDCNQNAAGPLVVPAEL